MSPAVSRASAFDRRRTSVRPIITFWTALVDVDRLEERPTGRRSGRFDVVEERPLERHRAPSARRPPTTPPARRPCEVQRKRRSSWLWMTMKMLTIARYQTAAAA